MNIYTVIITTFAAIFNLIILIFPKEIINSAEQGLILWYKYALPSLFPFMIGINFIKSTPFPLILSKILSPVTDKLFKTKGYGTFAMVSGLLSGYPIGAKIVCDLYKENKISKSEAQYLIAFSNNSGPLFIIGTIGIGFLGSQKAGCMLLAVHYLSALIIGIVSKKPKAALYTLTNLKYISFWDNLRESMLSSINAIVSIGGYIVLFSIICTMLTNLLRLSGIQLSSHMKGIIYGILEITNGCSSLKDITAVNLSIISGITAFGGLSVQSQSIGCISQTDLSISRYFSKKAAQGIISGVLCLAICRLIKIP